MSADEDFAIFQTIVSGMPEGDVLTMNTTLRSELAALQFKRDSLLIQLQDTKCQLKDKEEKTIKLESEVEFLKEQAARQNVVIASLRKRIHELEEKERNLNLSNCRIEASHGTLQREKKYVEDKAHDLERKVNQLEIDLRNEELQKFNTQKSLNDFVKRVEISLGSEGIGEQCAPGRIASLVDETNRLRAKYDNTATTLTTVSSELEHCRAALYRVTNDRDSIQQQMDTYILQIDRLKQDKEKLEYQRRDSERELIELKEKLAQVTRSLNASTGDLAIQGATINSLKDELKEKEEKSLRLETELRHLLESLAILLSTPTRYVESHEGSIKEKVRDLLNDAKDKSKQVDSLQEKVLLLKDQISKLSDYRHEDNRKIKDLEEEKNILHSRLNKTEVELSSALVTKDGLRHDKAVFVTFLERLARALNMDEIAREVGIELHTESILLRAEQLSRLESDKLIDKSAVVYQLQRRIRTLRDQLQRRDLHLDLLRRKLTLTEDGQRMKGFLQSERDEATLRSKKLNKQVDRLQIQLNEARALSRDLKVQLQEMGDYKTTAIDRGRKIEDLQKRLIESENLRTRCTRKISLLKDQLRVTSGTMQETKYRGDEVAVTLREELNSTRAELSEANRIKTSLSGLRNSLCNIVGISYSCSDYELISKITKMSTAQREYSLVTKRYDDLPTILPATTSPRYTADDSGFLDPLSDDVDSDINSIYNKRILKCLTPP